MKCPRCGAEIRTDKRPIHHSRHMARCETVPTPDDLARMRLNGRAISRMAEEYGASAQFIRGRIKLSSLNSQIVWRRTRKRDKRPKCFECGVCFDVPGVTRVGNLCGSCARVPEELPLV